MHRSRLLSELRKLVRATRVARANRMTLNDVVHQVVRLGNTGLLSPAGVGS